MWEETSASQWVVVRRIWLQLERRIVDHAGKGVTADPFRFSTGSSIARSDCTQFCAPEAGSSLPAFALGKFSKQLCCSSTIRFGHGSTELNKRASKLQFGITAWVVNHEGKLKQQTLTRRNRSRWVNDGMILFEPDETD